MPPDRDRAPSPATWIARLGDRIADWSRRNPKAAADLEWVMGLAFADERDGEQRGIWDRLARAIRPPNWHPLPLAAQDEARKVMAEAGLCLLWVPRAEVVEALIGAGDKTQRDAVLVAHADTILDDVDRAVAEVLSAQLAVQAIAAKEVTAALRAEHWLAGQALAAAALSGLIHQHFHPLFKQARARLQETVASGTSLRTARRVAVHSALVVAIASDRGGSAAIGFNRHATAHGVSQEQYTHAHALNALLLLTGAVRELEEQHREEQRLVHSKRSSLDARACSGVA